MDTTKRITLILKLLPFLLGILPIWLHGQTGVSFQELSFAEVLKEAQNQGKHVFIDGYATWCGPCKRMDATTFRDAEVGAYFDSAFVSIKVDMEKDEGLVLADQFGVNAFPTYIFLDGDGDVLHKGAGYFDVDDFLELAQARLDTEYSLGTLRAEYDAGRLDGEKMNLLLEMEHRLLDPHYMEVANTIAKQTDDWETDEMRAFIFKYTQSAKSPFFKYLVDHKKDFYDQFGQGAVFGRIETLVRNRSYEVHDTSLEEMEGLFDMVYPKQAKEMASKYRLSFYRQKGDRQNYAKAAIHHYEHFPSKDPEELNEVGATFSRVIEDQIMLKKIIPLVEKSIKLEDAHYNNDTMAAILFKLGDINGAKSAAVRAISLAKSKGEDASYTEELLAVIKTHESN